MTDKEIRIAKRVAASFGDWHDTDFDTEIIGCGHFVGKMKYRMNYEAVSRIDLDDYLYDIDFVDFKVTELTMLGDDDEGRDRILTDSEIAVFSEDHRRELEEICLDSFEETKEYENFLRHSR